MSAEYKDLRKLLGLFLRPRKEARSATVKTPLKSNNVFNTIYQSGKSLGAAVPKTEALTRISNGPPSGTVS